jgi:hypothetical protein
MTPCPPWCTGDHDDQAMHRTRRIAVDLRDYLGYVSTVGGHFAAPEIAAHGFARPDTGSVGGHVYVPLEDAEQLAGLLDALSCATPGTDPGDSRRRPPGPRRDDRTAGGRDVTAADNEADAVAANEALADMGPDGVQLSDYHAHMAATEAWLESEPEAGQ